MHALFFNAYTHYTFLPMYKLGFKVYFKYSYQTDAVCQQQYNLGMTQDYSLHSFVTCSNINKREKLENK